MSRAVSKQTKALQSISQFVGRSTQQMEVSQPVARAIAATQPAVERRVEPRPQPATPAPVQQQRPAQQQPAPALRGTLPLENRQVENRQVENRQAPAPAQPVAPSQAGRREEGGGWISDLLRGASQETPAASAPRASTEQQPTRAADTRNPRHMVESLNSLSVDIARAIDHDASVELWRRYQRGERDVFTRRLYTLKGQTTFDEIKRKYEREAEFRTAVDRYINDFEKLLADVARTDRDRSVTQSYLTSDTGKVYTMLAHAAGRFN